jgi:hypothetical protein
VLTRGHLSKVRGFPRDLRSPHKRQYRNFNTCSLNTKEEWSAVLRLAHLYSIHSVHALASRNLGPLASAIDKIVFGRAYGIEKWLLDAYVNVCVRRNLISLEDGERLGVRDLVAIAHARRDIEERALVREDTVPSGDTTVTHDQEVRYLVWRICCPTLDVPDLSSLHAQRLFDATVIASDPLCAADAEVARLRAELQRKKAQVDVIVRKLDDACARLRGLQDERTRSTTDKEAFNQPKDEQPSEETERRAKVEEAPVQSMAEAKVGLAANHEPAHHVEGAEQSCRANAKTQSPFEGRQDEIHTETDNEYRRQEDEARVANVKAERKRIVKELDGAIAREQNRHQRDFRRREAQEGLSHVQTSSGHHHKGNDAGDTRADEHADCDSESDETQIQDRGYGADADKSQHRVPRAILAKLSKFPQPRPTIVELQELITEARAELCRTEAEATRANNNAHIYKSRADAAEADVTKVTAHVGAGDMAKEVQLNIRKRKAANALKIAAPYVELAAKATEDHRRARELLKKHVSALAAYGVNATTSAKNAPAFL